MQNILVNIKKAIDGIKMALLSHQFRGVVNINRGVVKSTMGVVNFGSSVVMYQNRSPNTYNKRRFDTKVSSLFYGRKESCL